MAISKIPGAGVSADTLEAGDIADDAIGTAELANDVTISTSGNIATTGSGTLSVAGTSTLTGNVTAAGTHAVTGNATVGGTLGVTGNATASGNLTVTGDIVPSSPLSHRNVIYNGDCRVAQRGGTSTNPTAKPNTVDVFHYQKEGSPGNVTCTQATVSGTNAPGEFAKSFKVEQTSTVSPGSTAYQQVVRKVEAHDCQRFNATTGTTAMVLSFWVKANYADTFSTAILNIDGVRIVTYEYTTVANEWQKVTHVIPADSGGGSYDDNNDRGVEIRWWLTAGSNYIGGATTSWKTNSNNNTNVHSNPAFSTDGREWEITGVQLEQGGSVTPFEHKSYAEELAKCQRYFYVAAKGAEVVIMPVGLYHTNVFYLPIPFPHKMRSTPTLVQTYGSNYYGMYRQGDSSLFNSWSSAQGSIYSMRINNAQGSLGTAGWTGWCFTNNSDVLLAFQAEIG